ncbi:unnamed protein product [Xylocopa violacea]|uniref:2',5'-phosphodiesterase 12 n=2 Tax=Xylocopa violacea TaxID=135666 RepID=A0ABP1NJE8_XYLVO
MTILLHNLHLRYLTSFLPIVNVTRQFFKSYSQLVIQLKMNEAIVMHKKGSANFNMSFRYVNPELNVDRQFNFSRQAHRRKDRSKMNMEEYLVNNVGNNNIKFVKNHTILDGDLTCESILEDSSNVKFVLFDTEYELKKNVPYITKLELPSSILIDCPTYPTIFEGSNIDKTKSTFNWFKEENNWIHIGEGYLYIPTKSDLGCKLKLSCVPKNDTQCGPLAEIVSNGTVDIVPDEYLFNARHAFTKNKLSGKSFRITSYNILANVYSETSLSKDTLYPYCPHYALSMDYRKLLILKELLGYNSDVICLQEVDGKVYDNDLQMSLNALNYDSVFNYKNEMHEGLAIFYNRERFDKLICNYSVLSHNTNLDQFSSVWSKIQNDKVKQTFLNRNTIIQVIALRSKENPEILIVGNTHLYFKPNADHIRLLQAYSGLIYLNTFVKKMKEEHAECNVSILYCGDFNSVPENGVYQLMTQNYIPEDHGDWRADSKEHVENISIKHDLNLSSACGTPEYTNYTAAFSGCLDYIFYQTDHLEVEQVIPMPSKEELSLYVGLPSIVAPSDHIALCVDLKWSK